MTRSFEAAEKRSLDSAISNLAMWRNHAKQVIRKWTAELALRMQEVQPN